MGGEIMKRASRVWIALLGLLFGVHVALSAQLTTTVLTVEGMT